jgi:hypothetical protein
MTLEELKEKIGDVFTPELELEFKKSFESKSGVDGKTKRLQEQLEAQKKRSEEYSAALESEKRKSLTDSEKQQVILDNAIQEATEARLAGLKMQAKFLFQKNIQGFSIDDDTIDLLSGNDPDSALKNAKAISNLIDNAKISWKAAYDAETLKNNGSPGGSGDVKKKTAEEIKDAYTKAQSEGNISEMFSLMTQMQSTQ